ncbi:MAG: SLBB domain-containing protein, partial [Pyrinomonadaceae bacterium]|nr:SLBB domain-containing protein [Pyrinomonadaceae bacterium]
ASPVYVTGAVMSPQGIYVRENLSLRYAIAMTGGLRKDAKAGDIKIFRRKLGTLEPEVIKVDYNAIKNQKQPDVELQAYDVVDVPSSVFTKEGFFNTVFGAVTNNAAGGVAALPLRILY